MQNNYNNDNEYAQHEQQLDHFDTIHTESHTNSGVSVDDPSEDEKDSSEAEEDNNTCDVNSNGNVDHQSESSNINDCIPNKECEEEIEDVPDNEQLKNDPKTQRELIFNLDGKYWNSSLVHLCLAATTKFSHSHASIVTPKYGFNKGIEFFK